MAPDSFDLAIIGAGPAGSTAAYAAAGRGLSVALVDRQTFPRDKTCGDGIGPGAVQVARRLGLDAVFVDCTPIDAMTIFSPDGERLECAIPPIDGRPTHGYVIARLDFDDRLFRQAIKAGAADYSGMRFMGVTAGPEWRDVELRGSDGTLTQINARLVIGADGAYSAVRKALNGRPERTAKHVGLAMRAYASSRDFRPGGAIGPRLLFEFSGDLLPNYGWIFPLDDGRVNIGVGGSLRSLQRRGSELKELHATFAEQIRARGIDLGELHDQRAHHLPHLAGMPRLTYPRAALLGDAAAMINPVSGEGIAYGLTAAAQLIESLPVELGDGDALAAALARFERDFHRRYRAHVASTRAYLGLMRSRAAATRILRAQQRDPRVLEAGVDLLFGFGRIHAATALRILKPSFL